MCRCVCVKVHRSVINGKVDVRRLVPLVSMFPTLDFLYLCILTDKSGGKGIYLIRVVGE